MRAIAAVSAAVTVTVLALVCARGASAQETPPDPHAPNPHAPAAPHGKSPDDMPIPEGPIRFRAIDVSAMWEASHGGQHEVDPKPLANRAIRVLVPHGGPLELTTDADGRLVVPEGAAHPGETIEFVVAAEGDGRWPAMAGTPVRIGPGQPGEIGFVKVHDGPDPLRVVQFLQTATLPGREDGNPTFRVNLFAAVENTAEAIWMGRRDAPQEGTFRIPIPAGLTVVGTQISQNDVTAKEVARPDGGVDVVFQERFYPTSFSGQPQMVRIVLSGPWDPDKGWDFSFRAPWDMKDLRINLESRVLGYDDGDGDVSLEAAGPNPPVEGRAATHAWTASSVTKGQLVGLRIVAGGGIDRRVVLTLGAIGLAIAGAALLAKAVAVSRRGGTATPPRQDPLTPAAPDDRVARLADLERRRTRGEITSFEYAARKSQLEDGLRPATVAEAVSDAAPPDVPRAGSADARRLLAEIAARADTADEATLRRDVKTLLAVVRGPVR